MNWANIKTLILAGFMCGAAAGGGCSTTPETQTNARPRYTLEAAQTLRLNPPGKDVFEASGLLLSQSGDLLTVSDHGPTVYRIQFPTAGDTANLQPLTNLFAPLQRAHLQPYRGHYDIEGIAQDEQGRIYLCEEGNRWILRCDPKTSRVECLPIDWTPVQDFFSSDRNASFEGVAIGDGKLYVANERSSPLIIVVDLQSLKIVDYFVAYPKSTGLLGIVHYSDLCWHKGSLYVLCRHNRVVLKVDPQTHAVLAEYDYRKIEDDLGYLTRLPTGIMEGLAVDDEYMWLATDNNGLGHEKEPQDTRPTIIKCRRPERP